MQAAHAAAAHDLLPLMDECWCDLLPNIISEEWTVCQKGGCIRFGCGPIACAWNIFETWIWFIWIWLACREILTLSSFELMKLSAVRYSALATLKSFRIWGQRERTKGRILKLPTASPSGPKRTYVAGRQWQSLFFTVNEKRAQSQLRFEVWSGIVCSTGSVLEGKRPKRGSRECRFSVVTQACTEPRRVAAAQTNGGL